MHSWDDAYKQQIVRTIDFFTDHCSYPEKKRSKNYLHRTMLVRYATCSKKRFYREWIKALCILCTYPLFPFLPFQDNHFKKAKVHHSQIQKNNKCSSKYNGNPNNNFCILEIKNQP